MTETFVFELQNLYIPEDEVYDSEEFPIRIEPVEGVKEFEEERRENGSEYGTGYWRTAQCFIGADEERARELAEWLSFVYSFFQMRDVRWDTYYPATSPEDIRRANTYRIPIDNTQMRFIKAVHESGPMFNSNIGSLVGVALRTLDGLSEQDRRDVFRNISMFLQAEASNMMALKHTCLWMVLEANANRHYNRFKKSQGDVLFDEDEQNRICDVVLSEFGDEFSDAQLRHLEWLLNRNDIYEDSSRVKILDYVEYLDLGFDMDEVDRIIREAHEIRNRVLHQIEEQRLKNNSDILVDMRKLVMFVILRELGVEPEWQNKLATPKVFGPESEYEFGS